MPILRISRFPLAGFQTILPAVAITITAIITALVATTPAVACTNFIASPKATVDGSVIVTYTCDGEFHPILRNYPAADYGPDDWYEINYWSGGEPNKIKQPAHTYAVVNLMNEHQLTIGETTTGGREELINPDGMIHYWHLMKLALQRAATAREAIRVMGELVAEHGYRSSGESFAIGDPEEAWIMEMVGPGPGGKGAHWVALRVPDGYVSAYANLGRIGTFPLDKPNECLYSQGMIEFATEKGWYDPDSGKPFSWREAFHPATPQKMRYTATRVWSLFRRCAPSLELPDDYHRGVEGAEPYPLWIKPDEKLSLADVFDLMRDHYEGTPFDMTQGVDAGPYGTPNRWRPMGWEIDGAQYTWERPISTQQTGFSMVSQSRRWLPDPVGGVTWYGLDDTYFTCWTPLYCGIDAIPVSYATGSLGKFSWDSAWWVFNFVSNLANLKYSHMIQDIQAVQNKLEGDLIALQPAVDKTAAELAKSDPELMIRYLTDYSVYSAEEIVDRWRELGENLLTKYNDGYVKDENGRAQEDGYSERWLRNVLEQRPEQFRLPDNGGVEEPEDY
ncbi:MAG: C69 family dipeptidase [Gemmatimonadales bacterium]|nr:C69 family dipeptidase [Gemmatimonadales bacterium]